jgi:hypothetical protein
MSWQLAGDDLFDFDPTACELELWRGGGAEAVTVQSSEQVLVP